MLMCVLCVSGKTDDFDQRLFINNWLFSSNLDILSLDPQTLSCFVFTSAQLGQMGDIIGLGAHFHKIMSTILPLPFRACFNKDLHVQNTF